MKGIELSCNRIVGKVERKDTMKKITKGSVCFGEYCWIIFLHCLVTGDVGFYLWIQWSHWTNQHSFCWPQKGQTEERSASSMICDWVSNRCILISQSSKLYPILKLGLYLNNFVDTLSFLLNPELNWDPQKPDTDSLTNILISGTINFCPSIDFCSWIFISSLNFTLRIIQITFANFLQLNST